MKSFIKIMKALSDSNRVKIIKLLQHKTMCVCELQAALNIAQPTVSKHLKILEDAHIGLFQKGRALGQLFDQRRPGKPLCRESAGQPSPLAG
jgi:DNA-binding transcriptional ArsR family regulator